MTRTKNGWSWSLAIVMLLPVLMGADGCEHDIDIGGDADAGAYDPCNGLSCGDSCTLCPPTDPSCVETADLKLCQPDGTCSATATECAP